MGTYLESARRVDMYLKKLCKMKKNFQKNSQKFFFSRDSYFDPLYLPNPTSPSLIEDIFG